MEEVQTEDSLQYKEIVIHEADKEHIGDDNVIGKNGKTVYKKYNSEKLQAKIILLEKWEKCVWNTEILDNRCYCCFM